MNKYLQASIIILLILSLLLNLLLLFTLGTQITETEDQLLYLDLEWCEISNRQSMLINDLIESLSYYNTEWLEVEQMSIIDCFGSYEENDN